MPYHLLAMALLPVFSPGADPFRSAGWQLLAYGVSLPLVAATGWLFPLVRTLETHAAQALCGVRADVPAGSPAASDPARLRTAGWFTLHVGLGGLVSGASLAVPPLAVVLLLIPFVPSVRHRDWGPGWGWVEGPLFWTTPFIGAALLATLVSVAYAAGVLLARGAAHLLGPTPADRLAAAEERARMLASRNRLARDLHDSVGHALSAVTLQAGAARRVLDADPEFAREALTAIEETARDAVAELDTVLGILREADTEGDRKAEGPLGPTLAAGLAGLLARTRASGARVECRVGEEVVLEALPAAISREAYRIMQEGLSNALRHAGTQPMTARLVLAEGDGRETLEIVMENPLPNGTGPAVGTGGGRGLAGVEERATLLGGSAHAGPADARGTAVWRLSARLPLAGGGPDRTGGRAR
ncbi:histidine kinase [Streptomyces sp. N2-109]|uniref:histidine kinase n=1 Tax=Streptomyces gossypii TaxID=2883101 RepID=A0ABT2K0W3_9ACTN|nr:histidine kinase [Streptomyces gossypii]MCT2593805.1 histidine kinase [Streptomyces gossypii]